LPALIDYRVTTLSQVNKRIAAKLNNLSSQDRIQKFVADIYNMFDRLIMYDTVTKNHMISGKQKWITDYKNFIVNNSILLYHKNFMRKLNCDHLFINCLL
jgi:5'(3')-deoxyribonucleotidase